MANNNGEQKKRRKVATAPKTAEGANAVEEVSVAAEETIDEGTDVRIEEAVEVPEDQAEEAKPKSVPKGNRRGSKTLMLELEKMKELAQGNEDKYKRLLAEFDNARQRNEKESKKMYDIGAKEVLEKFLPVVDNFERALASVPEEDKTRGFEQGIDMIYKQLMTSLESVGVTAMNAEGTQFNPELHNAVIHIEDENYGENVVVEEMQKGYMYKDYVLRHSMVKVAN